MYWIWVVLIGLLVGAVAKLIMPGKDPGGFIVTTLLGIAGPAVGTWIGRAWAGIRNDGRLAPSCVHDIYRVSERRGSVVAQS